jgi:hypothetical protein
MSRVVELAPPGACEESAFGSDSAVGIGCVSSKVQTIVWQKLIDDTRQKARSKSIDNEHEESTIIGETSNGTALLGEG